jgi:hypothetical protein
MLSLQLLPHIQLVIEGSSHFPKMATLKRQPPDSLDSLPTELKCAVARYVDALTDRKALVLVNKGWSGVILPFLWETFTTDLILSGQRHLLGLADPQSNIIKYVRNINLLDRSLPGNVNHLPKLLAVIPRGQLRAFRSVCQVQQAIIELLLMLHSNLEVLDIPADSVLADVLNSPWTTGCFSSLTSFKINIRCFSSQALQRLWGECTSLIHLEFQGYRSPFGSNAAIHEDAFKSQEKPGSTLAEAGALRLESLRMDNTTLPKSLDTMFQRIDILTLHELTLNTFVGAADLLDSMASCFAENTPSLKKLRILNLGEQTTEYFVGSLFSFLTSFCGLQELTLHCTNCHKIDADGIVFHGETLRTLFIVNGGIHRRDKDRCYGPSDLQKIATACLELEHLSLNLYELDTDRGESDFLGPRLGTPFEPSEFEQALNVIASLPKLYKLRLTNPPDYRDVYHRPGEFFRWFPRSVERGQERYRFQARADGVMRYLGAQGSNLQCLLFSPVEPLKKVDRADAHGHVWPEYTYRRGRLISANGMESAVAIPSTV